jgi:hypothetical protein
VLYELCRVLPATPKTLNVFFISYYYGNSVD